jgi:Holliday junction resolvase RusA-like endonuclease
MQPKKFILNITPQTHVRATQGDRILFRIPRANLRPAGLKRLLRLERYNDYKISLSAIAKSVRFIPPEQGAHITFYIPVSKSWRKHKKESLHLMVHQEKPDVDNLYKAFLDSMLSEDKHIADVRLTKKWVNQEKGWIEILVYSPSELSKDNLM